MNLKALHHYLTTLSPSEEKYRNGYIYDGWKDMPKKQHNGVEYSVLDLDVAYFSLDNKHPLTLPGLMQNSLRYQLRETPVSAQFRSTSILTLKSTMSIPVAVLRLLTDIRSLCKRTRFS